MQKLLANSTFVQGHEAVVVEPLVRDGVEVSVTVVEAAGGPVALVPVEVAMHESEADILDAELDLQRHSARLQAWLVARIFAVCNGKVCARSLLSYQIQSLDCQPRA